MVLHALVCVRCGVHRLGAKRAVCITTPRLHGTDCLPLQVVGIRPKSEGVVQLRSSDPFDKPHVVTNYLQDG